MPTGTAALLRSHRALTADGKLTDLGQKVAEVAAARQGFAPDPAVRAVVAREVARRQTADSQKPRRARVWPGRLRDVKAIRKSRAAKATAGKVAATAAEQDAAEAAAHEQPVSTA